MTAVTIDPDSVLWSAPERERADRPLLVLMHGYGSHEGDLFGLSPHLPLGPVVASVRAPIPESGGFAWFPYGGQSGLDAQAARLAAADAAAVAVLEWLDTLEYTSVGLLGFSQGGAMALQLLRHAPERFLFAANLSGFALTGERPGDEALLTNRPPVFWGRGTADTVIGDALISVTDEWLPAHSTLTERIYEDLAHSISQQELADVSAFIRAQLG
jgi:phospholipase/carboxylesterase